MGIRGVGMIRLALIVGVFFCLSAPAAAGAIGAPRITRAVVDWRDAAAGLGALASLQAVQASAGAPASSSDFSRLNAATAERLPGIDRSSVPVLLPFDVEAFLRDHNAG